MSPRMISRSFAVFIKMDVIKTFQFSVKKTKWKENPSILEDFSFQKKTHGLTVHEN